MAAKLRLLVAKITAMLIRTIEPTPTATIISTRVMAWSFLKGPVLRSSGGVRGPRTGDTAEGGRVEAPSSVAVAVRVPRALALLRRVDERFIFMGICSS